MNNIDIEKLSRKMPYKALDEGYFETLPLKTLSKLNAQQSACNSTSLRKKRSWSLSPRALRIATAAAAAVLMVGSLLTHEFSATNTTPIDTEAQISEFVATLSDSDLELLISEAESSYDFYTNL